MMLSVFTNTELVKTLKQFHVFMIQGEVFPDVPIHTTRYNVVFSQAKMHIKQLIITISHPKSNCLIRIDDALHQISGKGRSPWDQFFFATVFHYL